ncbi:hypothetical protein PQX77_020703 [Marasmius sp. AFHP31]|nr:hypothetical protein PQX77_020703 [Marasmius sp. AFHP31]
MSIYPESLLGKSSRPPENFRQFFRNPISDINRKEVKDYLSDAEGAYNECQLEINKYKGLILMLESRREGMKKVMERCRSLLSPVHRLPSEVLLEIFGHCCEFSDLSNRKIPPTMALSMVCGRWREVALSSPCLWSSISITIRRQNEYRLHLGERSITRLTRLFMERSKTTPLKIQLDFPHDLQGGYSNDVVMGLIDQNSKRWEELKVCGREIYASSQTGSVDLPILRRLTLYSKYDAGTLFLDRFRDCPALTSVCTDITNIEDRLQLPWANIRHLKLREYTDASDLAFIESCTSLQHLTLVNVNNSMGSSDELTIQSNTIRNLIIKGLESDPSLIYRFNFPQLSSLDIQRVFIEDLHMEPFKQRISLPITSLRLDSIMCFTDSFLIPFLRCTPELRTLDISECWENPAPIITDSFSVHLTVNPDGFWNPPFLPRLAELKLKCHTKQLDEQAFANALTTRWLPNPAVASSIGVDCLQSVDITIVRRDDDRPAADVLPSLRYLRDVGMQLRVAIED